MGRLQSMWKHLHDLLLLLLNGLSSTLDLFSDSSRMGLIMPSCQIEYPQTVLRRIWRSMQVRLQAFFFSSCCRSVNCASRLCSTGV